MAKSGIMLMIIKRRNLLLLVVEHINLNYGVPIVIMQQVAMFLEVFL